MNIWPFGHKENCEENTSPSNSMMEKLISEKQDAINAELEDKSLPCIMDELTSAAVEGHVEYQMTFTHLEALRRRKKELKKIGITNRHYPEFSRKITFYLPRL